MKGTFYGHSEARGFLKGYHYEKSILLILFVVSESTTNWLAHNTYNSFPTWSCSFKVAGYSFSGSIPPKFEHKLHRHKQRFGKIDTTVVLDKDENLLWLGYWPWKTVLSHLKCNIIARHNSSW